MKTRSEMVNLAESWLGKNERDGSYKEIIDTYNSYTGGLPRGIRMLYSWPWCACTWSALGIKLGFTDIIPIEISCGYLIARAKDMGVWQEADDYVPQPGDAVLYDWDDFGKGDNVAWPDHVGMVEFVSKESGYFIVIEGNYNGAVKKRTVSLNGKFIRGFITPKYDEHEESKQETPSIVWGRETDLNTAREVIAGVWGDGQRRKDLLTRSGFDYYKIQELVNQILNGDGDITMDVSPEDQNQPAEGKVETTCKARSFSNLYAGKYRTKTNLYCRNDAGTNKKALCLIPKGTEVRNYGYYTVFNGVRWLLVQVTVQGVQYTGFCSSLEDYLEKM